MAATKYYAWTPIWTGRDENSGRPTGVTLGEEVDAKKLGVSKEEFDALVAAGSVRASKYPVTEKGYGGSPVDFVREQVRKMSDLSAAGELMAEQEAAAVTAIDAEEEGE